MTSLTSLRLSPNWASAAAWLATVPAATTVDASVRRLVGLATCAIASDDPAIASAWRTAHAATDERAARSLDDRFPACDPYLVVFAAAAALGARLPIDGFRSDLRALAAQLQTRPASARSHPRVFGAAMLLRAMGYEVSADRAELNAWVPPSLEKLFDADDAMLANLGHWLTLQRCYDDADTAIARIGDPADVTDALVAIAVAECRAYRLTTAADVVRAVQAAELPSEELAEIRNFLVLQQRDDGAFGYRNPFVSATTPDDATRFHLPISLATLIAFAEYRRRRPLVASIVERLQ